jgi:type I restriction system adenine methylase HsdM
MALKKSELYSSLWQSCDELRGGMDASQYKDYVLVLLFLKYISDKYAGNPFAAIKVPAGSSFADMVKLKGKTDIGDQINKAIIAPLATANAQLSQSDFPDFNDPSKLGSGKEMVDRLTNLIGIFESPALDFSKNRAEGDDILGDAYEYLMRHFATESGKSKGQFYTPAEVSRIMAKVLAIGEAATSPDTTVYDPTCGSGSLLLKVADEARTALSLYGQEKDSATSGLARMNMILHDYPTAEIKQGNTLANPLFTDGGGLKLFDYVVANPPFSDKRWGNGVDPEHDPYGRFEAFGIPPGKQGDYAYLLHIVRSLKSTGKGACILPHGVLFRGNAEGVIRKKLIRSGYLKGIIGLPANLFYGTGIPACILVLDKEHAAARKGIFMIDASAGFIKDGNKNRLRSRDIHKIVDAFTKGAEIPGYSRLVPVEEIEKNDFNLNLPRYIDNREAEDIQDIQAHLRGGIPQRDVDALADYWAVCPTLRKSLFRSRHLPPRENRGFPLEYFETCFELEGDPADLPASYGIVTAYATTGETWTDAQNVEADTLLAAALDRKGIAKWRITGYSPRTGHAEPGWAIPVDPEELVALGKEYLQHAVYHVKDGFLSVRLCESDHKATIGAIAERMHPQTLPRVPGSGYLALAVETGQLKEAIHGHPEFATFVGGLETHFETWRKTTAQSLRQLAAGCHPKEVIHQLSEGLLTHYIGRPLLDSYAVYQHLMDYWAETMQDDVYLIAADGWKAEPYRILVEDKKGKTKDKGWTCDLVPKALVVARYFAKEQAAIEAQQAELESITAQLTELEEEQGGEDGAFSELEKINKAEVTKRLKEIKGDKEAADEEKVLKQWTRLNQHESELKSAIKDAEAKLDAAAYAKYSGLNEDEVKTLVVDGKWLATLDTAIHGEIDRIEQALTGRVKELAERYAMPMAAMTARVAELETRVAAHLERMGFAG